MTCKYSTSPEDPKDDKRFSTNGCNQNLEQRPPASKISTIYDPRLVCSHHHSVPAVRTTPHPTQQKSTFNPKKSLVENIKKISHKLYTTTSSHDSESGKADKRVSLIKLLCLAILGLCKILIILCIILFLLKGEQRPDSRNIIVDGEFQILNRKFEYDMLDKESAAFKELSFNLSAELNRLFRRSDVAECYRYNEILEVTLDMTIKSIVVFQNCDRMNVGRIGLAFLRSLRLHHGHTFLGQHTINVQSIGFQIRGEEGIWGEWSDWTGCDSPNDYVAKRTRLCLTRDTFQETNSDRCLLIPGNKGELDTMPCKEYQIMKRQKEIDDFTRLIFEKTKERGVLDTIPISLEDDIESGRL